MRVALGLSGGVDSAVAASRLLAAGHDVVAVHYSFLHEPRPGDAADARAVAAALGVPFEIWDFSAEFRAAIVDHFVAEYEAGRTPNPCVRCNRTMKFGRVLRRALASGFDAVATGHYARLDADGAGGVRLRRAVDATKDQSYVLAALDAEQLRRCLFPLGGSTKAQVRAEASTRGLAVAERPDSLDVCFIADGDTAGFLAGRLGDRPGPIVDLTGAVVGSHAGAHRFTVGQRRGLRLQRPAADGRPRYVVAVAPAARTITVGGRAALRVDRLRCGPPTWTGAPLRHPFGALVQFRAHGVPLPAHVTPGPTAVAVAFAEPAYGVAPGQQAVFYDGDVVVGSATIEETAA
nr:tRNA 2-thiouridine(34) synthase MnmA [Propionibacterium sp.]